MYKLVVSMMVGVLLSFSIGSVAGADSSPGDVILILGEDLNEAEKATVMDTLAPPENALEIVVTNEEEHQYLGEYISAAQIGTRALSSAMVTIGEPDSGVQVETSNINWVTEDMYTNALVTAGVKDAEIQITAPFEVSGTAALTGLIKAYEASTDEVISEEQKQVANEEMVKTANLAELIGAEKANSFITAMKEEIANNKPETEEEMRQLMQEVADRLGIQLPENMMNDLVQLFMNLSQLNIDWGAFQDQLTEAKDTFNEFINSEEGQGFFQAVKDFFTALWDAIMNIFSYFSNREEAPAN
ncbi:DUF1002 domain-containing protein [Bacillus fonticola]|uniref:DUF1002 domain-containing protein n=1 Tax=Bacillus fonticola TaxID=2728853 RepID=UPI0014737260|nr:DUF1002 domain-containing protein [Bacillus fonticola]